MTDSNTPAFISPDTFVVDGDAFPGVFTAFREEDGQLQITIRPIGSLTFGIGALQVVIDDHDLRSVKALLRAAEDEADEAEAGADEALELPETADATPSPA